MKKFLILGLFSTLLMIMALPVAATVDSWGIGSGIPYGPIGVNFDYTIMPNIDISFGLGVHPFDDKFAHSVGLKLYFLPKEKNFRPRLSCYYGTNTYVEDDGWGFDYTSYDGVSIGIGASAAFGHARRHGLDFDLLYIASTEADIDQLNSEGYDTSNFNDIKISIGYRHFF